jgi:tRNA pseudouridine13 synthase
VPGTTSNRLVLLTMSEPESTESPRKKVKLSSQLDGSDDLIPAVTPSSRIDVQTQKELDVGITDYISPHAPAFSGILKKRYTDFLVNEILPNGEVLHLRSTRPPRQKAGGSDDRPTSTAQNEGGQSTAEHQANGPEKGPDQVAGSESSNHAVTKAKANNRTSNEVRS